MELDYLGGNIMGIKRLTTEKQREAITNIKKSFINGLTASQVETYIDNNVSDLASAKTFLKQLSKVVLHLLKK